MRPAVELDAILTALLPSPRGYVYPQGGNVLTRTAGVLNPAAETVELACLAYVVRHPSAGTLLIDTGLHPDAIADLRRDFGLAMGLMFARIRPAEPPYDEQLGELGVDPAGELRVLMTHLHVDHTSGMRLLPRATFVCSRAEWRAATGRSAVAKGYVGHHLPPASRVELIDFERDGEPHGPFPDTVDLLGDGAIRLISTPGHTAGHMSVLLRLSDDRQALIAGDAAYTVRAIREQILPLLTADERLYAETLQSLKAFADAEPDAIVVPSHDPDAWRELPQRDASAVSGSASRRP